MAKQDGESLVVSIQAFNKDGEQISQTDHEVYGLDNHTANVVYNMLIDGMQGVFTQLDAGKNPNAAPGKPGR